MSLATLSERLEFGTAQSAIWADVARNSAYTLVDKYDIINSSIRAEPPGYCGLTPQIDSLERRGPLVVLVHF